MPNINNLYAQTLDQQLPPQDTVSPALYQEKLERLGWRCPWEVYHHTSLHLL